MTKEAAPGPGGRGFLGYLDAMALRERTDDSPGDGCRVLRQPDGLKSIFRDLADDPPDQRAYDQLLHLVFPPPARICSYFPDE
jgi:hypothetical protein